MNTRMPQHVVQCVTEVLNDGQKSVKGAKILVLGLAYKPETNDLRESPALAVIRLLEAKGGGVVYGTRWLASAELTSLRDRKARLLAEPTALQQRALLQ